MTQKKPKDFYGILGVPPDATADDIKKAYRKLARELHPDYNPGNTASEERFKAVSQAYAVLGDERKRGVYDEKRIQATAISGQDLRSVLFKSIFEGGLFSTPQRSAPSPAEATAKTGGRTTEPEVKPRPIPEISLLENDLGLLAALSQAYGSKEAGVWEVRKAETDEREWIPEIIYRVQKDATGAITLSQAVKEFRLKPNRETDIMIFEKGYVRKHFGKADSLVDESVLRDVVGIALPPFYNGYISAIKELARKQRKSEDVSRELAEMRLYVTVRGRPEGKMAYLFPDHDIKRNFPLTNIDEELNRANSRVTRINFSGKEGQQSFLLEGKNFMLPKGFSGRENKG